MAVCRECGYRNTPDNNNKCNYCGKTFEEIKNTTFNDPVANILIKYGHKVLKIMCDDNVYYVELDRSIFNTYKDDFSVENQEIMATCNYTLDAFDINTGVNVKIWFRKI